LEKALKTEQEIFSSPASEESHSVEVKKRRKVERPRHSERMPGLNELVEARSVEIFKSMHCVVDPFEMLKALMKDSANEAAEMESEIEKIQALVQGHEINEDSDNNRR